MTQIRPQPRWAAQPQVRAGAPQAAAAGKIWLLLLVLSIGGIAVGQSKRINSSLLDLNICQVFSTKEFNKYKTELIVFVLKFIFTGYPKT